LRYYDVTISDPVSKLVYQTGTGLGFTKAVGGTTFTSYVQGQSIPGALQVEFDLPVAPLHIPQGQWYIRVWGIGLPMIGQASQLAGMDLVLRAGMKKGLPLANPAQSGVIITARIFQAFGNWQGVNQTLDLVVFPPNLAPPTRIAWDWKANTPFSQAIVSALAQAFPGYKIDTTGLKATLQQASDDKGTYESLSSLSVHVQQRTRALGIKSTGDKTYQGVFMQLESATQTIFVYDNSNATANLAFVDLIGQPTWIDVATVSFKTVLRADINIGNKIKFPQGVQQPFALNAAVPAPGTPSSSKAAFQGEFSVTDVHHYANFRQPDAESWNTTFSAVFLAQT
jgi:hypothetical protein